MSNNAIYPSEKRFKYIWIFFTLAFVIVLAIYFTLIKIHAENFPQVTAEGFSGFGAFVGGVGGTLFSAIAAGLVYMAYSTQKEELRNSVKVLTETQKNQSLQSYLSALTPAIEKISHDFNRPLVAWYNDYKTSVEAFDRMLANKVLAIKQSPYYGTEPTALSEIITVDQSEVEDHKKNTLGEIMAKSLLRESEEDRKLRFFMIQFVIQVTAATHTVLDMSRDGCPPNFYYTAMMLLSEVNVIVNSILDSWVEIEGGTIHKDWFRHYKDASSRLNELTPTLID